MGFTSRWKFTLIGIAITLITLLLALFSAGAGHGTYFAARLLYQWSIAIAWLLPSSLSQSLLRDVLIVGPAVVQFAWYGISVDLGDRRGVERGISGLILILHITCAAVVGILWEK